MRNPFRIVDMGHNEVGRPYRKPNWFDYDLVMGQDHEWYLYSNILNAWYPTGLSWSQYDEDEMIAIVNARGVGGDWLPDSELFDDI